jgi:hypothetical protein
MLTLQFLSKNTEAPEAEKSEPDNYTGISLSLHQQVSGSLNRAGCTITATAAKPRTIAPDKSAQRTGLKSYANPFGGKKLITATQRK